MRTLISILTILLTTAGFAQIQDPVKWQSQIEKSSDSEYVITLKGTIEDEWHMYSQFTPEGGAQPTELVFENAEGNYEPVGKAEESEYVVQFNDVFEVDEYYFADEVTFTQKIKVTNPEVENIQLTLFYQACVDVCIPQDKYFVFDLAELTAQEVLNFEAYQQDDNQTTQTDENVVDKPAVKEESRSLWGIFIATFLFGFT